MYFEGICHPPGRGPSQGKGPGKQGTGAGRPTVNVIPHKPFPMFGYPGMGMQMFPSMGSGHTHGWGSNYGYGMFPPMRFPQYPSSQQQIGGQFGFPQHPMHGHHGRPSYPHLPPGYGQHPNRPPVVNQPGARPPTVIPQNPGVNTPIHESEIINFSLSPTGGVP